MLLGDRLRHRSPKGGVLYRSMSGSNCVITTIFPEDDDGTNRCPPGSQENPALGGFYGGFSIVPKCLLAVIQEKALNRDIRIPDSTLLPSACWDSEFPEHKDSVDPRSTRCLALSVEPSSFWEARQGRCQG